MKYVINYSLQIICPTSIGVNIPHRFIVFFSLFKDLYYVPSSPTYFEKEEDF